MRIQLASASIPLDGGRWPALKVSIFWTGLLTLYGSIKLSAEKEGLFMTLNIQFIVLEWHSKSEIQSGYW